MRQVTFGLIAVLYFVSCRSQDIPTKNEIVGHYGFEQKSINSDENEIVYYTYSNDSSPKTKMILYLQGSDPSPQFSYRIKDNETQKLCWLNGEFKELTNEYIYVVVEKIGFEGVIDEDNIPKPEIYQQNNSLDNRVFRANEVINELCAINNFDKVIVYGHSEGAPVAAKLGSINEKITNLGFWAGNALPDFYDFILESRIQFYKGEISVGEAQEQIDKIIGSFVAEIAKDTANVVGQGYTNKRWWSYSEPPMNNLLKIDIPIFVQVATNDESAPIESTYLIPLEFARLGKTNLTYKVCVGCDHGFHSKGDDGTIQRNWNNIFNNFLEWANENDHKH